MVNKKTREIIKRLQRARMALMVKQPFYAVLLMHMRFALDEGCETAYTDSQRIAFCTDFIKRLSDSELEFVLMHEVLHVALNHCGRSSADYDFDLFNEACDIVVNSNILYSCNMNLSAVTLSEYGESMHRTPDGKEGYLFTAEEVYDMLKRQPQESEENNNESGGEDSVGGENGGVADRNDGGFDDHTFWQGGFEEERGTDITANAWLQRMIEATKIADDFKAQKGTDGCGNIPLGTQRIVDEYLKPQTDWRTVLNDFVQEEINDYSFNPPDRRFQASPFLLPDYNEKDEAVKDILFMVDTSASVSDKMITQAFSEIKGAIDQFNGRLEGWLGFFDASVVPPKRFSDEDEFRVISPKGGGGTSFKCIFDYIRENTDADFKPVSIIILTDGYAPFPDENEAEGIPVLWIINNKKATPPWGKTVRLDIGEE